MGRSSFGDLIMTAELAFSLFLQLVLWLYLALDVGMFAFMAYLIISITGVTAPKTRNVLVWTILICAILTAFRTVVLALLAWFLASNTTGLDEQFWQYIRADFIALAIIGLLAAFPVVHEARRRQATEA